MKTTILKSLPVLLFFACCCQAEDVKLPLFRHSTQSELTNVWSVSFERLRKTPQWKSGESEPPLSVGKAVMLAKAWCVSKGCSPELWVEEIEFRPVFQTGGEFKFTYYYNILFGNVTYYGHYRRCIVLMDGTVVEPDWLGEKPKNQSDLLRDE
jgi:hypothetical protein